MQQPEQNSLSSTFFAPPEPADWNDQIIMDFLPPTLFIQKFYKGNNFRLSSRLIHSSTELYLHRMWTSSGGPNVIRYIYVEKFQLT